MVSSYAYDVDLETEQQIAAQKIAERLDDFRRSLTRLPVQPQEESGKAFPAQDWAEFHKK